MHTHGTVGYHFVKGFFYSTYTSSNYGRIPHNEMRCTQYDNFVSLPHTQSYLEARVRLKACTSTYMWRCCTVNLRACDAHLPEHVRALYVTLSP
jgi:hypothetical protein